MKHAHAWKRVAPVVVVIDDPAAASKGGKTYNAECDCGTRAWVHWRNP